MSILFEARRELDDIGSQEDMNMTNTESKLAPETDAQRNVRILSNRACAARNLATAAENNCSPDYEALNDAADSAEREWAIANRALVVSGSAK